MSTTRPVLTPSGAQLIAQEIERLRALREVEFTTRRREALAVSAVDADARLAIGEDQLVVDARIAALETLLRQATIVAHRPPAGDVVGIGSHARLEDVATGAVNGYAVVAWHDGVVDGTLSAVSPVGQAILGRALGEEVTIDLPRNRVRRLRIAAIEGATPIAA